MPAFNGIGWFEIGTDNPEGAKRFYGEVFGWTAAQDNTTSTDPAYQVISTGDAQGLRGAIFATQGELANYAVFGVLVEDVAATCRRTEAAGGKVQREPVVNSTGVTFAHLLDPDGNQFAVFTPPSVRS
ncbi:VOC family protein [Nocardia sp. NBC_01499]|uniref:VOC family protein n=1 Tax=Nocardia sp. NBC_01499 TaxID=2903597 RepID=UPI00386BA54C